MWLRPMTLLPFFLSVAEWLSNILIKCDIQVRILSGRLLFYLLSNSFLSVNEVNYGKDEQIGFG